MSDKNSFETVELLEPISLIQIDGSEPMEVKEEAKALQVPKKTDEINADNAVTVSNATDVNTNIDTGTSADQSAERILVDPKKLFGNNPDSGEKQDYQKHNYAARFIIFCIIGIFLLFTLLMVKSFKDSDKQNTLVESNFNPSDTPVYKEIDFDADEIDAELPVIINHRCVEYTYSSSRILYFTATSTEEDVGLMINVEMFDKHGHSLGASSNSNSNVAVGDEFIIPVFFSISSDLDLRGVTYKIKAETFKDREEALVRTITDVTEAEKGHFLITCEGTAFSGVNPYVVLYKNGKVVGILNGYSDFDETGKAVVDFYKTEIDYDTYKVFY